ncbi:MAG: competence protein ComEC, partial [Thermoleophilaceae bacterium]|nr:competence protein ComEC [Thermoleophilaceae bacterium]
MEAQVARRWRARAPIVMSVGAAARRSAAALGRRPHHLAMGALAAGLLIAPNPRVAMPVAALSAGAVAMTAARAAGKPSWPLALLGVVMVCGGGVVGAWRVTAIDGSAERAGPDGAPLSGRAILLEHPRQSQFGSSAAVRMTSGRAAGSRVLARLDGFRPWPDGGEPGAVLELSGSVERPAAGGSFDWRAYLRRRGIAYELGLDSLSGTGARRGGIMGVVDSMRRRAERALGTGLPAGERALARGMVL